MFIFIFSGCQTIKEKSDAIAEKENREYGKLVGKEMNDLKIELGNPTEDYIDESGNKVFIYKTKKYICSTKDEQNRKKIFDLIPKNLPRTISIGRLDFMSEGLLLLTNNGDFARKLELPAKGYERIYRVCIRGKIDAKNLEQINNGIRIDGIFYKKIKIKIDKFNKNFTWLIAKLKEGKNREIRNICKHFSWHIVKLIRIQFGPYKLGHLKEGQIEEINIKTNA